MNKYKPVGKIGEGTFSDVLKTQSLRDGNYYACKQMKQHFESIEQVNSLREIQALRRLNPHPNILMLHEVVFDRKSGCLALICELMDMNIYELIRGRRKPLPEKKIMNYMYQLCKSLDHMHRNGIFHRDVKPENILIKEDTLKLGDFGSCRSVYSKQPYTEYISTRWYRAPECLLTDGYYSYKMDMWSSGCVFYEITRTAEKQAVTMHRKMRLAENIVGQESINLWCISKDGNRQHSHRKTQQNPIRHHGPSYAIELPKLNVSGVTKLTSYPSPTFHSVFTTPATNGEVPVLQPIKYIGTNHKSEKQKELKSSMKQYHLPTIERRGGGY
nr:MAPK/MAK/MRK overlapping kinase isoform X7 [Chrysemys picta bellii]